MRTAFINQLIEEARKNDKIFLIVGDLGYSVVEPFANEFPDRFLNAGVAEQNMTGVAAGLASEGYIVFTYSIANFPTLRAIEQIRNDVCYHNLNVNIVAVGGGYSYGSLGMSHHATEEIGMLRTLPNLTVISPGDPKETKAITSIVINDNSPSYIRLGKAGEPIVYDNLPSLKKGKMIEVLKGEKTAVLSSGSMLKYSYDFIKENKVNWGLYSVPFIKPFDVDTLVEISTSYQKIITIEEHQKMGGLGSVVAENLVDIFNENKISVMPKVKRIAIEDIYVSVANSQNQLRKEAGLELNIDL